MENEMTTENQEPKLTINDPVDAETLKHMEELQIRRAQVAERLLDLENERVRLLRMAQGVDMERSRVFETINLVRGLPTDFPLEIDAKTGSIRPLRELPAQEVAAAE